MCVHLPRPPVAQPAPPPAPEPQRPTPRETAFLIGICLVPAVITLAVVSFFAIAISGGQIR